jgi:transposase
MASGRWLLVKVREILNAIFYVLSTGCQWEALRGADRARDPVP